MYSTILTWYLGCFSISLIATVPHLSLWAILEGEYMQRRTSSSGAEPITVEIIELIDKEVRVMRLRIKEEEKMILVAG